jgi:pimeloyl-ACP methyl ester carboxylesterase
VVASSIESSLWKKAGRTEGWLAVTREGLLEGKLRPTRLEADDRRSLLLIHGTFSSSASAFRGLAEGEFFDRLAPFYGDRIFAFDHFSVSRTPEENARMLLQGLPTGTRKFDVVTHSRGGLVLRYLVEGSRALGPLASRFALGSAVIVAAPNQGTPLATPDRWEETVGWLANLIEVFPENGFSTAIEFVAEGITWLARHVTGTLPGISAMDSRGANLTQLNSFQGAPPKNYYSLVANYAPAGNIFARMADAGVDAFFSGANDLVVPSEGGWKMDNTNSGGTTIGCFGRGGNINGDATDVHHLNFFSKRETHAFITSVLATGATGLPSIDPSRQLPTRLFRSETNNVPSQTSFTTSSSGDLPDNPVIATENTGMEDRSRDDTLQLMVIDPFRDLNPDSSERNKLRHHARLIATFNSANMAELFRTGGDDAEDPAIPKTSWGKIIAFHRRLKTFVDGRGPEPTENEMIEEGTRLFDALFPGNVRRLYDEARSRTRGRKLNVVFTSEISWVADLPWEFAFDPTRKTFLATEEIHFVRNAFTAVPAELIVPHSKPLRLLVAVAQPIGTARLSAEEERGMIQRAFQPLIDAGAVNVSVLPKATPASLHSKLSAQSFDVLHFVGHGAFDVETQRGSVLFEDESGNRQPVNERQLREIICGRGVRLVFFNACESGRGALADFNRGVAPALIAGGIPAVVANQFKVLDAAATAFAQRFYWSLANGLTLGQAARESRIGVNYSGSDSIDWAVPVLYAHNPEAKLCICNSSTPLIQNMPVSTRRSGQGAKGRTHRIAVWDVKHSVPILEEIIDRLNAVQSRFGFELVSLAVPSGTLDLKSDGGPNGRRTYFNAPRAARKLADRVRELGRDFLICITDLPMRDSQVLNIYSWSGEKSEPVSFLSTWGFNFADRGIEVSRFFANNFVGLLTWQFANLDSHKKGPKDCPAYYNDERSQEVASGRQRFDMKCKRLLQKELPAEDVEAIDALLSAFDEIDDAARSMESAAPSASRKRLK